MRHPLCPRTPCAAVLLSLSLAAMAGPSQARTIYNDKGLRVEETDIGFQDYQEGRRRNASQYTLAYQRQPLCGKGVKLGERFLPAGDPRRARDYFCGPAKAINAHGVLAFVTRTSGHGNLLYLDVGGGDLRITDIPVQKEGDGDSIGGQVCLDAGEPGWTRYENGWYETTLIRHEPFQAVRLGPGRLLDIDHGVALLLVPRDQAVQTAPPASLGQTADGKPLAPRPPATRPSHTVDPPAPFTAPHPLPVPHEPAPLAGPSTNAPDAQPPSLSDRLSSPRPTPAP
ncbi:hypothetical protein, partial [Achromobacter ruhlandii]|uniref:hypothetical protein n=1 Tax=Achromobacter ruhlandii TaxID=72557 RepID=UPI0020165434